MKNKFVKSICVAVLLPTMVFMCALGGVACKNRNANEQKAVFTGVHDYTAPETNQPFIANGRCDYFLVISQSRSAAIDTAKEEFLWLFKKASGIALITVFDTDERVNASGARYISLGRTSLLEKSGIEIDRAALGIDGGRIVTKDSNIYIAGGEDRGTLYAVYTFMSLTFNFEQYYKTCLEIDTGVKNLNLKAYNVTDIPDIAARVTYNKFILTDTDADYDANNFGRRMRMDLGMTDPMIPVYRTYEGSTMQYYHNTEEYLPQEIFGAEHPEWFSSDGHQLCYTARGNEAELTLMIEEVAKKITHSLSKFPPDKFPDKNVITFTVEDGHGFCTCDACAELFKKYNESHAGAIIRLLNRAGAIVDEWMKKPENAEYRRDDFTIIFFAYNAATNAPCKYNEKTEKWEPIDETVIPGNNIGVWLAPIQNIDYQQSIYAKTNKKGKDNIDAWAELCGSLYFWTYSTNYLYYCYMYDTFDFFNSEGYGYLASTGAKYLFNQPQTGQTGTSTAWHNLKIYLEAKLAWNSGLDTGVLTDNWFNAMFKEAAPIMKRLFLEQRAWNHSMCEAGGFYVVRSIYSRVENKVYWPYAVLKSWTDKCEDAVRAIEQYKVTDPKFYEQIYYHIGAEWISPAYITLKLYRSELSVLEEHALVAKFKDVVSVTGMGAVSEHNAGSMQEFAKGL